MSNTTKSKTALLREATRIGNLHREGNQWVTNIYDEGVDAWRQAYAPTYYTAQERVVGARTAWVLSQLGRDDLAQRADHVAGKTAERVNRLLGCQD